MTSTVSADNGAGSVVATTVLSPWSVEWESRNVVHDLVGGDIAVSLVASRLRSGQLQLLMPSEDAAHALTQLLRALTSFTLTDEDRPAVGMTFVVDGRVALELDDETLDDFVVSVDFQEVDPA